MPKSRTKIISVPDYFETPGQQTLQEKEKISLTYSLYEKNYDKIFRFLNTHDQDLVLLMNSKEKTQNELAEIFCYSQPKMSYDKRKINKRVNFLFDLQPMIDRYLEFLESDASKKYSEEMRLLMTAVLFTTSFTRAAELTGIVYGALRSKFSALLETLKRNDPEIYDIFTFVKEHLNTVKRLNRGESYNAKLLKKTKKSQKM